ncbi:MAG: hypothetical protein LBS21_04045 [Clostridiales bacterium]|jgi:hypothetical protein|nr:hypothetical protein [Clostridiales bacterium]
MKTYLRANSKLKLFAFLTAILLMAAIVLLSSCQNGAEQNANAMDPKITEEVAALLAGDVTG